MKRAVIFLVFILFSLSLTYAIELKAQKNAFSQGETILFSIDGNIISPIKKENIGFFEGHVQKPFFYDAARIRETYYIYTITPYRAGEYSIKVSNIYYKENNEYITGNIGFNFTISNTTADFYVSPGFIITNKNFNILVSNNKNSALEINYGFLENFSNYETIPKQNIKSISIDISNFNTTTITNLSIKSSGISYSLPIYIIRNISSQEFNLSNFSGNISVKNQKFKLTIEKLNETIIKGDSYNYSIPLLNTGDTIIVEINVSVSDSLKDKISMSGNKIYNISVSSEKNVLFTIKSTSYGNFSGYINFTLGNYSLILPVNLFVGDKLNPVSSLRGDKSCSQLGGKVCSFQTGEICSIPNEVSSDNSFCCLGECIPATGQSSRKKSSLYLWVFILVILLIIGFLFWKYKKSKSSEEDILDTKIKKFSGKHELINEV
ncbi:MAG: hypothetical protein QXI33_03685 [Candidatus Pacearchaeota archaeon]